MSMVPLNVVSDNLRQYITAAQSEDIAITEKGKTSAYLISAHTYEHLKELEEALEDVYWGEQAEESVKSGFIGVEASEKLHREILNAKDQL